MENVKNLLLAIKKAELEVLQAEKKDMAMDSYSTVTSIKWYICETRIKSLIKEIEVIESF